MRLTINPETGEKFTDNELLKMMSEDLGRLSRIEWMLQENDEDDTGEGPIYNRMHGIELRTYETVNVLFSIKRLLIALVCLFSFNIVLMILLLR